jgi:hypothetical protein
MTTGPRNVLVPWLVEWDGGRCVMAPPDQVLVLEVNEQWSAARVSIRFPEPPTRIVVIPLLDLRIHTEEVKP